MPHQSIHFFEPQPQLLGISRNTLKTDVVNMLEGYNLRMEDVKVDYNRAFRPMGMLVQFQSWKAFDNAARLISRKGRLYKLERANRSQWDNLTSYDGKTVLLKESLKLQLQKM